MNSTTLSTVDDLVQKAVQHREEQVRAPGYLHMRGVGQDSELRPWNELLHEGAVLDRGEVPIADHEQDR